MPALRYLAYCLSACLLLGCSTPATPLTYRVQDDEPVLDLKANPNWQPAWNDSLIARLERGALPAYDRDNRPLPADSLQRARRLRGVVLVQNAQGKLEDGTLLHQPQELRAVLHPAGQAHDIDLYFYDQAVALELFYARVRQADLEALAGRRFVFVPAK
ncbi:hypothetical protein [Hymenobacter jeollabukensis]|uniref:Uncharacterized protein n=1 Tax=Hymenobacter jeollabukensis TaxID=2025313 RepID=A0A5R8WN40_9BACT|nr:hypothetical protein [Hymenobacter jeollabukensis]TLM91046.1 hypothetical protein FDY95_15720 [Hymenobacter jeollabukensis]